MKITYGELTLCDGAERGVGKNVGVRNFRFSDRRAVQVSAVIGSSAQRVNARGNKILTVSFDVNRQHATVEAAEIYCLALYATLTDSAVLTLTSGETHTAFNSAALDSSEHSYKGVRTYHHYQFVIGYYAA